MHSATQGLWLFVATALAFAALTLAPPPTVQELPPHISPAPPGTLLRVAALGRDAAAADVAWLRTVQFIGSPHSARVQYAGLEGWVDLVTDLDPKFETPYFHGSILLATSPGRERLAADILDKAEQNLVPPVCREPHCPITPRSVTEAIKGGCEPCPILVEAGCDAFLPLSRGFVDYFGFFDSGAAAETFCEARRRGGPAYLTSFAARLADQSTSCVDVRRDLQGLAGRDDSGTGTDMLRRNDQQLLIAVGCEERELKRAAAVFRLRRGRNPHDVNELLEEGAIDALPWRPSDDVCWQMSEGKFQLLPCEAP